MQQSPRNERPNSSPEAGRGVHIRTQLFTAAFLIFGFGILLYQLYKLQIGDLDSGYRADAVEQQLSDVTIAAERGSIYDSTGKLLAKSTVMWNIAADPAVCQKKGGDLTAASREIAAILGVEQSEIYAKLTASNQYQVLAKKVDMPTADKIMEYVNSVNSDAGATVLSVWKEETYTREYPFGTLLSGVLGFCNADGEGVYGLEKSYEDVLAGTDGRSISYTNVRGGELASGEVDSHDAIDGSSLHLTIDSYIQSVVESYLEKAVEDYNVQNRACAIVMNVKTGAIYAMATTKGFDPNEPYTIYDEDMQAILDSDSLSEEDIATLQSRLGASEIADIVADGKIDDSEYSTVQGKMREAQWKNKNITELYTPGSVFKLVVAAAALDSGKLTADSSFYCGGKLVYNEGTDWEHTYRCANEKVHGWQDMAAALNNSCNIWFIQAGETLGGQTFYDYTEAFGFTETTGIDLPYETRWTEVKTTEDFAKYSTDLASSSFGQAEAITPMQMATAVAAVVNGGYLVTPHVVDSISDANGNTTQTVDAGIRRQVISEEVSAQLRTMMEGTVGNGTDGYSCRNAYVAGYRIGAKSGTAEQLHLGKRYDDDYRKGTSFAAVVPINDPEIEVFIFLDDPRWLNDYASQIVAPIAGNIISEIAPYLGLERDSGYDDGAVLTIHEQVGKSWTDAQVDLNKQGFLHKIIGSTEGDSKILYQYPYAGTSAPVGSTIYLYTETTTDTTTTVPDVTGKSVDFAKQMLKAAGLNANVEGDADGRVTAQSVEAGSTAPLGTVVMLTAGDTAGAAEQPVYEPDAANEEGG
ncbi:MAG: penicillin-binding transpeptidase domain-containing protein [Gemmiger sp.]